MKTIRFLLDWHSYPLWIYDGPDYRNGELLGPQPPEELKEYPEILENLDMIYDIYDSLFVNNTKEFYYKGFTSERDKEEYISLIRTTISMIRKTIGYKYCIVDDSHLERL
jgi:hypothetical protein